MAKPKAKRGIRARFSHAIDSVFGSSSAPPSPKPEVPSLAQPPPASDAPGSSLQVPLQALSVSALVSPVSSIAALPAPVPVSTSSFLQIPAASHTPAPSSSGSAAWSGLSTALRTLHTNSALFPPLQSVIGGLVTCVEAFEESTRNQKEYKDLAFELKTLSETLDRHLAGTNSSPMMQFITETMKSIQEQLNVIEKAQSGDSARRALGAHQAREALTACDHHIQALCRELQLDASLSLRGIPDEQQDIQLRKINPAKLAAFDSHLATDVNRRTCTKDTRTAVLLELTDWSTNPDSPNVCWMNGMAGTGKTTIACTFAKALEERKLLGATFFCTRTTDECRDVTRIIPTIAYQLACRSAPFRSALCRVIEEVPDIASSQASTQFDRLLRQPLVEVKDRIPKGLVVVIDALDECTASNGVELLLDALLRSAPELPLRFLVASRPEPSIWNKIQNQSDGARSVFVLHNVKQSDVQADIELYLRDELPSITEGQLKQLATLSRNLFIYAATAVRYIRAGEMIGEFDECLGKMLSVTRAGTLDDSHAEIDNLYTAILTAAENYFGKKQIKERMRLALCTAVCAREPVSAETLAALSGLGDSKKAMAMLQPLRSVLYVSNNGSVVSTLHASFPDFLLDPGRSSSFFCDANQHHQLIARYCFDVMKTQLRFNICGLESSYVRDSEVPNLKERVDQAISPTLSYVCRYWADHLEATSLADNLHDPLQEFLSERLLFWMEVMNLKEWIGKGIYIILGVKRWLNANSQALELSKVTEDTQQFVTSFVGNPVHQSTPHLYISGLAFCNRSSAVYKHYWRRAHGLIQPEGANFDSRIAVTLAHWSLDSTVDSVAYSPNSAYIAVGCSDGRVTLKDAYNGAPILPPVLGHAGSVNSVAFSPDSTRIASGSNDHTICVWNVQNGTLAYPPIKGHSSAVMSIAVSPDGVHIVSGSADHTVRVWNARDGSPAASAPFEGHTGSVQSVAISFTSRYIASGSRDTTIRMWDIQDSTSIGAPFKGHSGGVTTVAFSPDSTRIVSGSEDFTICIWNVQDQTLLGIPWRGHTHWVQSVAFSSSGMHIVSGSADRTVRLWDAHNGTPFGDPFRGHTDYVTSVMFSPDGTRIVSGSLDNSLRVWNGQIGPTVAQGHSRPVNCVARSPGGTEIVSGSEDKRVCVWNTQDGTLIGAPFEGHTGMIHSVAFSPDSALIASGSDDHTIRLWGTQDPSLVKILEGHTEGVTCVAFSPDGAHLVSGSKDKNVRIWDVPSGSTIGAPMEGHSDWVRAVAYSPDGAVIASSSDDRTIRVWTAHDGSLVTAPYYGHSGYVLSVAFSPDGTLIASGSEDCTIRVWNMHTGTPVGNRFEGHTDWVSSVVFSPDSQRVVSCSDDRTIRIWNLKDGTLVGAPFEGHADWINSLTLSPDGTSAFSGSTDGSIRAWNLDCSGTAYDTWTVSKDGWVKGKDSRLLFWVPPDVARILPSPSNPWVIGRYGPVTAVDYSDLLLGEEWQGCFT